MNPKINWIGFSPYEFQIFPPFKQPVKHNFDSMFISNVEIKYGLDCGHYLYKPMHTLAQMMIIFFMVDNIYDITISPERLVVHSIYLKSTVLFREGTSALTLREFSDGITFTLYLYSSRLIEIQI